MTEREHDMERISDAAAFLGVRSPDELKLL